MAWSNKTQRKTFNCGFCSHSVLHNADIRRTNPHTWKRYQNHLKPWCCINDVIFEGLPAIVHNDRILNLLKFVFICWCEYYLTISTKQILLLLCIQALRDWRLSRKHWYLWCGDANERLQEKETLVLRPCRNFASVKEGILECLCFYVLVKMTLVTSHHEDIVAFKARWLFQAINLEILCNLYTEKCENNAFENADTFDGWLCNFCLMFGLLNASGIGRHWSFSFKVQSVTFGIATIQ